MDDLLLHPALVHLPLGLAFAMPLLLLVIFVSHSAEDVPRKSLMPALALQLLLTLTAGASIKLGEIAEDHVKDTVKMSVDARETLESHEQRAMFFLYGCATVLALVGLGAAVPWPQARRFFAVTSLVGSVITAGAAGFAGSAGGDLVYEHGLGIQKIQPPKTADDKAAEKAADKANADKANAEKNKNLNKNKNPEKTPEKNNDAGSNTEGDDSDKVIDSNDAKPAEKTGKVDKEKSLDKTATKIASNLAKPEKAEKTTDKLAEKSAEKSAEKVAEKAAEKNPEKEKSTTKMLEKALEKATAKIAAPKAVAKADTKPEGKPEKAAPKNKNAE